jgi:hypothetical protein
MIGEEEDEARSRLPAIMARLSARREAATAAQRRES